ncbi:MAG: 50S ribosomal protein L31e [Candidatus Woesearchaeota archaeon]|jgi:large subunit ribosomal protein L31e
MEKIERTYTIPLRREYLKAPKYRRTEKASRALRDFLVKHMKSEDVKVGKFLNEFLWMHGMKNPPHHVKVNVVKMEGTVYAELFGKPLKITKDEKKKDEKKTEEKKEAKVEEKPKKAETVEAVVTKETEKINVKKKETTEKVKTEEKKK